MLVAGSLAMPERTAAAELKPEAIRGFDPSVQLTEQRRQTGLRPGAAFLWVDGLLEAHRNGVYEQQHRSEVASGRLKTRDPAYELRTAGALIHDWVGTVFIPGASLRQVLVLLENDDHHAAYFAPERANPKTLEHTGNDFKVYLRLTRNKIVTVVLDTKSEVHYEQLDAARVQSRCYSARITEVEPAGDPREVQRKPGGDHGFLSSLNSYWRSLETGRGVYVPSEAVWLTRDIPTGLGWLIAPFIDSIPKESLEFTLGSTRAAVLGEISNASK
jgi:hypothetical protein